MTGFPQGSGHTHSSQFYNQISNQGTQNVSGQGTQSNAGNTPNALAAANHLAGLQQAAIIASQNLQQSIYNQSYSNYFAQGENPKPLSPEGIKLGEIIGWRGWRLDSNGYLRSMSADFLWAPNEPVDGKVRADSEHNGIYSYKNLRDFLKAHGDLDVWGKISMWGRVIEHELGYRAEYAKIIGLEGHGRSINASNFRAVRDRYAVATA